MNECLKHDIYKVKEELDERNSSNSSFLKYHICDDLTLSLVIYKFEKYIPISPIFFPYHIRFIQDFYKAMALFTDLPVVLGSVYLYFGCSDNII